MRYFLLGAFSFIFLGISFVQNVSNLQPESCYYESHTKELTCSCESPEVNASLSLSLFSFLQNFEIEQVTLTQCHSLTVSLDLSHCNASSLTVFFWAIQSILIKDLRFEPMYFNNQELLLKFHNVDKFEFNNLNVLEALKIKAYNIKEAKFIGSSFAKIPVRGIEIVKALNLEILNSTFYSVVPSSIVIDNTRSVTVIGNSMNLNALLVIQANDGSHLHLECNRIFGEAISPECSRTLSPRRVTTPDTISSSDYNISLNDDDGSLTSKTYLPELLSGIFAGLLFIALLLLLIIFCLRRTIVKSQEVCKERDSEIQNESIESSSIIKAKTLIENQETTQEEKEILERNMMESCLEEDSKVKFSSPIWMDEIQNNKIFNRQKKLLSIKQKDPYSFKDLDSRTEESNRLLEHPNEIPY